MKMLGRIAIIAMCALAIVGCATPYSDPFAMEQRLERANNPFLRVQADPSQRLTTGKVRRALRGDPDVGAFEVEIGDNGAGLREDTANLLKARNQ